VTTIDSVLDAARQLTYGAATTKKNITVVPLIAHDDRDPDYLTLDEALAEGCIRVTEVNEHGSVPTLKVVNTSSAAVFLLDGEELLGAKQNRVINLSILVPASRETVIPVSCVESGRWRSTSETFAASRTAQFAEGRAAKMRQVTHSLETEGHHASDQGEVWAQIAAKSSRLAVTSDTSAMSALFEKVDRPIDDLVAPFRPQARQVGAVFAIDGRVAGLELFDAASTWRKLAPKLLRSYSLDALDPSRGLRTSGINDVPTMLARLKTANGTTHPAVGEGEDVRLSSAEVVGAALCARGRVIHLSVFPQA
jgi:hypothetical protein